MVCLNFLVYSVPPKVGRNPILEALAARGSRACAVATESELFRKVAEGTGGVVLSVGGLADSEAALSITRALRCADARCPLLLVSGETSEEFAIAAFRAGATDLLRDSCTAADAAACLNRIFPGIAGPEHQSRGRTVGDCPSLQRTQEVIRTAAATDLNVLITGETGTGKELVAERIHCQSRRKSNPFVCVNCAAIPAGLLESELFGHERGAFTGAHSPRDGKLFFARGGTVFLDEIGDMDLCSQAKILRAIESRRIQPLGGNREIVLNIRIIAATHQNLEQLAAEGRFRQDLYYRLNVVRIHLPPLRERPEDLPSLVRSMLAELNSASGRAAVGIDPDVVASLAGYRWPGNIRELRNCIEVAFAFCGDSNLITFGGLPETIREKVGNAPAGATGERERLLHALTSAQWNKSEAAKLLHWSRMTLYRKMSRHRIEPKPERRAAGDVGRGAAAQ